MKAGKSVGNRIIMLAGLTFCMFSASKGWAQIPSTLGWTQIPNTAMQLVCPTYSNIQAVEGCEGIPAQWGSGLADTKRNRLIIWGGGHNGYYGNEVYSINLGNNPINITLLRDAYHGSDVANLSASYCPDAWNATPAEPTPKHTGGAMQYLPAQDIYWTHAWGDPPCGGFGNGKWMFDPNTNGWAARLTADPQPHPDQNGSEPAEAYDPVTGKIFDVEANTGPTFWSYDYNANAWTSLASVWACLTTAMHGTIDPGRRLYICVGGGSFNSISLNPPYTVKNLIGTNCNGIANVNGPGMEYDPTLQKFVVWMGGDTVYIYDPDTDSCTSQTFPGGPTAEPNGTYGRFRYFPSLGVYAVSNSVSQNAYFLRLNNGTADTTPPTVTVTSPANGATVSGTISIAGTAADNVAVSNAQVSVDGGAYSAASGTTNWSFSLNTTTLSNASHTISAKATDTSGNVSTVASITLTVNNLLSAPVITSVLTASATVGSAFSYQITASNSPTSFNATGLPAGLTVNTATGLPAGLTVNTATGLISGTPTAAGISNVTINATNAGGTGSATLALAINNPAPGVPVITSAGTATRTVGTALSYQITATNSPTSFNAVGLPAGLLVNTSNGLISGTPTIAGISNATISAANSSGSGSANLVLTIKPQAPVINSPMTAAGTAGLAFGYQITATNNPTSFNAAGLPAGLSVNTSNGLISGTPAAGGTSSIALSAINSGGTGTAALTLTINIPVPPTVSIVPLSTTTVSGTVTLTASASSNLGIASVQFQLDGSNLGSPLATPPFTLSWNTLQAGAGTHSVTAIAIDIAGNKTTSAAMTVTVVKTADATPGLRSAIAYPNPAVKADPTIRAFLGVVNSVEVTIFDVSGHVVNSGSVSGAPTGILNGQYYYDYKWTGSKASGTYFAVIHGKAADGTIVRARVRFAVVQ